METPSISEPPLAYLRPDQGRFVLTTLLTSLRNPPSTRTELHAAMLLDCRTQNRTNQALCGGQLVYAGSAEADPSQLLVRSPHREIATGGPWLQQQQSAELPRNHRRRRC